MAIPESVLYSVGAVNDEYVFNTSGLAVEHVPISYSLEAASGQSLNETDWLSGYRNYFHLDNKG